MFHASLVKCLAHKDSIIMEYLTLFITVGLNPGHAHWNFFKFIHLLIYFIGVLNRT